MSDDLDSAADALVDVVQVLARSLSISDVRLQPTLDAVVSMASDLSSCEAGLVLVERGRLIPQAVTGKEPHLLDALQQERHVGPCIEAAQTQEVVRLVDTRTDERWEGFGGHAAALGVGSMLCFPLWIDETCQGTLSLYADTADAFDSHSERIAKISASLAAVALAGARQSERLHEALLSRDVIGQAKGVLMERGKVTPERAFELLAVTSQKRNRKLTVIARHLVETGELLGEPDPVF